MFTKYCNNQLFCHKNFGSGDRSQTPYFDIMLVPRHSPIDTLSQDPNLTLILILTAWERGRNFFFRTKIPVTVPFMHHCQPTSVPLHNFRILLATHASLSANKCAPPQPQNTLSYKCAPPQPQNTLSYTWIDFLHVPLLVVLHRLPERIRADLTC